MTAPQIAVVGHVDVDRVRTKTGVRSGLLGGSALYTALATAIDRCPVGLIATLCSDYPHDRLETAVADRLATDFVRVLGSHRRNDIDYTVETEGSSDRLSRGYASETWQRKTGQFAPRHVPTVVGQETELLHLSPTLPNCQRLYAEWATERGMLVSLDTSPYYASTYPDELRALVERVDLVVLSAVELELLYPSFEEDRWTCLETLARAGPSVVVARLGEAGCIVSDGDSRYSFDALSTTVVDPTGAGDSFNGGFLSRYLDDTLANSCQYGIAMATRCIEAFGNSGLLDASRADVDRLAETVGGGRS